MTGMSVRVRNNVKVSGVPGGQAMVFAHGFGCDQQMWRLVAPAFEDRYSVVLFDHVGSGRSDLSSYEAHRYTNLDGYARDVLELLLELQLERVIFVGHSVSAMIGVLAAIERPELFESLVLVGPSARYVDDRDYRGGFAAADIDELLIVMSRNYLGWSAAMAPIVMGNADRPELGEELTQLFCANDPEIAKHFAAATFLADNRADLPRCATPSLVLQMTDDVIAPIEAGEYVHRHLVNSELRILKATGHCPNLSAPAETIAAMNAYLAAGYGTSAGSLSGAA